MFSINRAAVIVRPLSPFFDWAKSLAGGLPHSVKPWTSVYLVAANENDEPGSILRRNFKRIFEEQLNSWYSDESRWPNPRTLAIFRQWFQAEVVDLVFDLEDRPPMHDD